MNTGTSKTALSAARVALLAGVSALALSLASEAANAQTSSKTTDNTGAAVTGTASILGGSKSATAVGDLSQVGTATVQSDNSTAIGVESFAIGSNTTVVGFQAGKGSDPTSYGNQAFGAYAGQNVKGSYNSASGFAAGSSVIGFDNNASGTNAGQLVKGEDPKGSLSCVVRV